MENLTDEFDRAEYIGRGKVMVLLSKYDLTASEQKYDSWDLSGKTQTTIDSNDTTPFFIECKDRGFKSTEYDTAFMEYLKLSHLRNLANEHNADMFYICTYTDDVAYIFNLKKLAISDVYIKIKRVKKTTIGDSEYEDKIFIELPLSAGTKKKLR